MEISLILILILSLVLLVPFISMLIFYYLIKKSVKNGVFEAHYEIELEKYNKWVENQRNNFNNQYR